MCLQTWKKRWAGAILSEKCCCFVQKEKEEEEEEEDFGRLATFWFGTFAMLFSATGCVARHKTLENER